MNSRNGARALMSRSPSRAVFVTFSSIKSHLFTAMMTAAPRSHASLAIFRSCTCIPSLASTTSKQTSRSEEHTSELQSPCNLVCRLLLEKKKKQHDNRTLAPTPCIQDNPGLTFECVKSDLDNQATQHLPPSQYYLYRLPPIPQGAQLMR